MRSREACGESGVGRQPGARGDRRAAAPGGTLCRAQRPAAAAGGGRQPRRGGAERMRAGGARAAARRGRGRSSRIRRARSTSRRCVPPMRPPASTRNALPFIDDMARRYAEADLVDLPQRRADRRRAGGGGRGLRCSCRCRGAIADEQTHNARFLVEAGRRSPGSASTSSRRERLAELLARLRRANACSRWRRRRARVARADAAERVADACISEARAAMKHKVKRMHFVGIGGAGMSGIAEVLLNQGYLVSGSDLAAGAATQRLTALGRARLARSRGGEHRRRRRRRGLERRAGGQPRSRRRAREAAFRSCRAR